MTTYSEIQAADNTILRKTNTRMNSTNNDWLTFLSEHGAIINNGHVEQFKSPAQPQPNSDQKTFISPLTERRLLSVTGADAYKFLQGQVTCDTEDLRREQMRSGAHCTHKGRMIASFRAFSLADHSIGLSLNEGCLEPLKNSLSKYIVFSKAKLADEQKLIGLGVSGKAATEVLSTIFTNLNAKPYSSTETNGCLALCLATDHYECWLTPEVARQFWGEASAQCQPAGESYWNLLCIRQGLSEVRAETVEMFIPQMLNFDQLNGISYKKGCYTGQEVVARMTYLGKLKRHTYRAALPTTNTPTIGADLYTSESGQSIGNIVMAAATPEGDVECLICATDLAVAADAIYIDKTLQQKLKTLTLPYAINSSVDDQ